MKNRTKLRLLYLYQHLVRNTDSEHTLSTPELIRIMKEQYSLSVSRNTISNDLKMLHDSGLGIEHYESTQNKYYYDGQIYDLAELKILVDAVASSKFITQHKSDELIKKLLILTSDANAAELQRHILVSSRVKSDNENGYYIVDALNSAINNQKKVSFYYTDFDIQKNKYITNDGNAYTVSPYSLIWDGDYYYLRGFCDERQEMRNFRLDRIAEQPKILEECAVTVTERYSSIDYGAGVFRMFDTDEQVQVQLRCHKSMMKYLIDNFGSGIQTEVLDENYFRTNVKVCTSVTFYRWVFGFGEKIVIEGPKDVRLEYQEKLKKALEMSEK